MLKEDLLSDDRVAEVMDVGVDADETSAYPHVAVAAARLVARGQGGPGPAGLRHRAWRGHQRQQGPRHPRRHGT